MWLFKIAYLVVVLSVFVLSVLYVPRFVHVYRIGERGIRIKLFGMVTYHRIWWTEIASVEVVSVWYAPLFYAIPAYLFSNKRVVVNLRKGLVRHIVLSPKDPDAFAHEVLECMKQVAQR